MCSGGATDVTSGAVSNYQMFQRQVLRVSPGTAGPRMSDKDGDLALLKRKIILVDKLVKSKARQDAKHGELEQALRQKEQELQEVKSRLELQGRVLISLYNTDFVRYANTG